MKNIALKIFLVILIIAAPAIFSACFRCPKPVDHTWEITGYNIKKLGSNNSPDSVYYADSTGLYLDFQLILTANRFDFSMGGDLFATKCVSGKVGLSNTIDSLILLANDSLSSVYQPGTSLNFIARVSKANFNYLSLSEQNKSGLYWESFIPGQRIFFTIDKQLSLRKLKVTWKLAMKDGHHIFSRPFYIISW